MYVTALIAENLDVKGYIRSVYLGPKDQRYRCAFADEYDGANSGPFHFPDENDQKKFEYQSRKSKKYRLSEKQFTNTGGIFHLMRTCVGIPTEQEILTYYALCLPRFAVPISDSIRVKDLRSDRCFSRSVAKNDRLKCFVIYLPCRSRHGEFDFSLNARFRVETPDGFRDAKYRDGQTTEDRYGFELVMGAVHRLHSSSGEVVPASFVRPYGRSEELAPQQEMLFKVDASNFGHSSGDANHSKFRAHFVAKIRYELMTLRPRMYGPDSYRNLEQEYPQFDVFKIANVHRDLREKIENIIESRAVTRLAQEIVAQKFGKTLSTVQTDWKDHKPKSPKHR